VRRFGPSRQHWGAPCAPITGREVPQMKYASELKHCQSVKAVALVDSATGKMVGKIIGHYSDNPNGSVVTVSLFEWGSEVQTARAGGGGYDKFAYSLSRLSWKGERVPYNGVHAWFAERGVSYLEVL